MGLSPQEESALVGTANGRRKKGWMYTSAAVIVVLGAGIPLAMAKMHPAQAITPTQLYTVSYGAVGQSVSTSGTVEAPTDINLNFQDTSAKVTSISVKIGEAVKKGQVLATVDDATEKIAVQEAQASLTQAKLTQENLTQSSLIQAQASLSSAQAKLAQDKQGTASGQIAVDKLAIQKAQTALAETKVQYQDQVNSYNDRSSQAAAVTNAQDALTQAQQELNTQSDSTVMDQQKLTTDEATLKQDQTALSSTQSQYGDVTQAQVQAAYQKYEGEVSLSNFWIDSGYTGSNPYSAAVGNYQGEYSNLNSAYQAIQSAQSAVTKDQESITSDQTTLAADQASQTQSQQKAQATVTQDEQALQQAQANYNDRTSAQQSLDNAKNSVTQAQESLASAQLTLKNDEQPATQATIKSDEATIKSDEASIKSNAVSIENAQASVQTAAAQLQTAQLNESETTLKAPMSGVITALNGQVGETVAQGASSSSSSSSTSGFITIEDLNSRDLEVNMQVSESQIGSIKAGQPLTLTATAYPNEQFKGTVTQVYPTPQVVSNVTEYTIIGTIDNASGHLKPGMSTSVTIQTASKTHVLTVPAIALHQVGAIEGVYVQGTPSGNTRGFAGGNATATGGLANGTGRQTGASGTSHTGTSHSKGRSSQSGIPTGFYFQPVQVGLMGSSSVEVTSGLTSGEKILLVLPGKTATALVQSSSSGNGRGFGGGFGGGGARGGRG